MEGWRQARFIAYMLSSGKLSVFDFYPLPNDPTPEEIEKLTREGKLHKQKLDEDYERSVLEDYKKRGFK